MFIGQYEHHLEEKGRLSVPKKFRSELATGAILSQGLDGCLFLYPKATWQLLIDKLATLPLTRSDARSFTRVLSFGAVEVETDRLGRILIPEYLKIGKVEVALNKKDPVVLEINTIPGLTPMSLLPKAAKAAGISYPKLLDRIINHALSK